MYCIWGQIQGVQRRTAVLVRKKLALMLRGRRLQPGGPRSCTGADHTLLQVAALSHLYPGYWAQAEVRPPWIGGNLGFQASGGGSVRRMEYSSLLNAHWPRLCGGVERAGQETKARAYARLTQHSLRPGLNPRFALGLDGIRTDCGRILGHHCKAAENVGQPGTAVGREDEHLERNIFLEADV